MSIAQEKITWRDYQPTINQTFHCKLILTFVFSGQVYIVKYMKKKKNRNAPRARECPQFWRRGLVQNSCQLSHQAQALPFSVTQKQRASACRLLTHLLLVSIINLQPQLCPLKMCQVIHSVDSGWTRLQTWRFLQHFRISIFRYVCVTLILVCFQSNRNESHLTTKSEETNLSYISNKSTPKP